MAGEDHLHDIEQRRGRSDGVRHDLSTGFAGCRVRVRRVTIPPLPGIVVEFQRYLVCVSPAIADEQIDQRKAPTRGRGGLDRGQSLTVRMVPGLVDVVISAPRSEGWAVSVDAGSDTPSRHRRLRQANLVPSRPTDLAHHCTRTVATVSCSSSNSTAVNRNATYAPGQRTQSSSRHMRARQPRQPSPILPRDSAPPPANTYKTCIVVTETGVCQ